MPAPLIGIALGAARVGARIALGSAMRGGRSGAMNIAGSMNIDISSNIGAVTKAIDAFGKNQIPFATHRALNDTAFSVRNHIVEKTYPRSFDVKNKRFASQMFRVKRSKSKRDLSAAVFDRFRKDYMAMQAEGGMKKANGRSIAIPGQDRPAVRGRASYNRNAPRTVLGRPKAFRQRVGDQDMILERRTKKRYPLKRLYLLEQQAVRIPKRFPFYEEGTKKARQDFDKFFRKRFAEAKRTARRR